MGSGWEVRLRREKKKGPACSELGTHGRLPVCPGSRRAGSGGTPVCGCQEGMTWKAVCLGLALRDFAGERDGANLGICFCK